MIAARVGQLSDFTTKADLKLDAPDRTIFELRSLSAAARARIQDAMVGFDEEHEVTLQCPGTGMLIACKYGVAGWKQMKDHEGNDVHARTARTHDGTVLLKQSLDVLADVYMEVGSAVVTLNKLDEDEDQPAETLKNGNGSPSSQTSPQSEPSTEEPIKLPTSSSAQRASASDPDPVEKPATTVAAT